MLTVHCTDINPCEISDLIHHIVICLTPDQSRRPAEIFLRLTKKKKILLSRKPPVALIKYRFQRKLDFEIWDFPYSQGSLSLKKILFGKFLQSQGAY